MTALLITLSIILIGIVVVQIGRVSELAGRIRGEEEQQEDSNRINASLSLVFMILFLIGCVVSFIYYKDSMLGYGPHESATEHGVILDYIFDVTMVVTGIVFFITQVLLFWFAYKYKAQRGRKALYMPHDNRLEVIWTAIPAVVMTFLVVGGLDAWNEVMADVGEDETHIEIGATGMQFAWIMRMGGPNENDLLGTKNYKLITPNNPVGMDWTDEKSWDDIISTSPGEVIKLPVNKLVRARITARDVLHNFDIPHFRVKMDAIPGMPTYFKFTPTITTEEYRQTLGATDNQGNPRYPEWWEPADPTEPDGLRRWEAFHFELACAELCGNGHYSMRRIIEVVEQEEFDDWLAQQPSYYLTNIRNTDEDPYKGKLLPFEIEERSEEFSATLKKALDSEDAADKIIRLNNINFNTGSAVLTELSVYELENLYNALVQNPGLRIEISGHTDNTGDPASNQSLSNDRAKAVADYLASKGLDASRYTSVGYGESRPVADNATEDGRKQNRRTEFKILAQ